jgi:hypothetical protein
MKDQLNFNIACLYGELQCISKPKISKDRCLFSVILCTPVNPTIAAAMEAKFSQRGRDLYSPKQGRVHSTVCCCLFRCDGISEQILILQPARELLRRDTVGTPLQLATSSHHKLVAPLKNFAYMLRAYTSAFRAGLSLFSTGDTQLAN